MELIKKSCKRYKPRSKNNQRIFKPGSKGIVQSKNELTLENRFITSQAIKSRYLKEDEQNHTVNDIIKYHNEYGK